MKCGKEISDKQAFCDHCLEGMAKFPISPDVKVWLPNRPVSAVVKKASPRKKTLSTEERLAKSKKAIQWLSIALAISVFALVMTTSILVDSLKPENTDSIIGQNYNTADALEDID